MRGAGTVVLAGNVWREGGVLFDELRTSLSTQMLAAKLHVNEVVQAEGAALSPCGLDRGPEIFNTIGTSRAWAAATRCVRKHPLARDAHRVRISDIEDTHRVVEPAELEEKLRMFGRPPAEAWLAPPERRGTPVRLVEPLDGCRVISSPSRDEPRTAICCGGWLPDCFSATSRARDAANSRKLRPGWRARSDCAGTAARDRSPGLSLMRRNYCHRPSSVPARSLDSKH